MIDVLLPPVVAVAERRDDPAEAVLFPEEAAVAVRFSEKRRLEFTTVRHCARLAMAELGLPPRAIVPGARREPTWPDDVVGSMTHCAGYRAAAVARAGTVLSLGIDAEPHGPLPDGVDRVVMLPEEQERLRALSESHPDVHWDRVLFSAKESVYKTWHPLTGRWLGFEEAELVIDPEAGTFTARLLVPGPVTADGALTSFAGRWLVRDGLVLTAITLI